MRKRRSRHRAYKCRREQLIRKHMPTMAGDVIFKPDKDPVGRSTTSQRICATANWHLAESP